MGQFVCTNLDPYQLPLTSLCLIGFQFLLCLTCWALIRIFGRIYRKPDAVLERPYEKEKALIGIMPIVIMVAAIMVNRALKSR